MNPWHQNKIIVSLLACACCAISFCTSTTSAQDISASIGDVDLVFCNTDNLLDHNRHLKIQLDPNKPKDLCLEFINTTDSDVPLKVNFVDGGMTADQNARRACKNEISKESFGQYVQGDITTITIPAKGSKKLTKTITLPAAKIGYNYGCVTYSIPDQQVTKQGGISYNVVVRKAGFIDAIVKGRIISRLDVLGPEGKHNVAYAESSYDSGSLIADALGVKEYKDYVEVYTILKNSGNVPLVVGGKGSMTTILGTSISLGTGRLALLPNESKEFRLVVQKPARRKFAHTLSGESLLHIPWYRMYHSAAVDLVYVPDIAGEAANLSDYSGVYHLGGTIFLMPWWLIVLLVLIAAGWLMYRIVSRARKRREQRILQKAQLREQSN